MSFYTHIENVRFRVFDMLDSKKFRTANDKAYVVENLDRIRNEYNQLKKENTKLREFARDMWCLTDWCHGTSAAEVADMYSRMRELGIMEGYGEEQNDES